MIPLNPKSYLYIGGAIGALLLGMWLYSLPEKYRKDGDRRSEAKYAEQARIAINNRNAEIEREKIEQAETNIKVVADYENQLKTLSERLASAKRDGLRGSKTICSGFAITSEATSAERNNEAADFRLPDWLTNNLYEYANRAEEIKIQLGSCQKWIRENGMFKD